MYNIQTFSHMNSIADIEHVFYINLFFRPDRKDHVEQQLAAIGIRQPTRFNAIQMTNGALGCSFSHLKLLRMAKEKCWSHILIVEDDILFTKPAVFVEQLNRFLSKQKNFDVLLIAGNNCPPFREVDDTCVQVSRCQTTTGYLVQQHYYDKLIENITEGINKLMREPEKHVLYAIDKYWFLLQEVDRWFLIVPLTVTQREDYSDIEKRHTNYSRAMLDLRKEAYFRRRV